MAYFPNGSSGDAYMVKWCCLCRNWRDLDDGRGPGCPVWDLHMVHNYDAVKNKDLKRTLNSFIPTNKEGYPEKCTMFFQIAGEIEGQTHFT